VSAHLTATQEAAASGTVVRMGILVHFEFADQPVRAWIGFGTLTAGGHDWLGIGNFGSVSGLSAPIGTAARPVTFRLSGVDQDMVARCRASEALVTGRRVTVYGQFFGEAWATHDEPFALWSGRMDAMTYDVAGLGQCVVTLSAETLFADRSVALFAYLSNNDQQGRFAGDKGLEFQASLVNKTLIWPDF
jgi:hypothetical protein